MSLESGIRGVPEDAYLVAIYLAIARLSYKMKPSSYQMRTRSQYNRLKQEREMELQPLLEQKKKKKPQTHINERHLTKWVFRDPFCGLDLVFGHIRNDQFIGDVLLVESGGNTTSTGGTWCSIERKDHDDYEDSQEDSKGEKV
jgi:hypothetical protein